MADVVIEVRLADRMGDSVDCDVNICAINAGVDVSEAVINPERERTPAMMIAGSAIGYLASLQHELKKTRRTDG